MSKKEILQNGIKQVFYEEEWYPPISEALKNLTAAQACWHPKERPVIRFGKMQTIY